MKKQFFRVKQLADQTFSRAGRTEVLSEDLEGADGRIEYIKAACQNTGKKLSGCLLVTGQMQGEPKDKILKKYSSEYQLGCIMLENSIENNGEDSLLKEVLSKSGETVKDLAKESFERDQQIETFVVAPLQKLAENDIPNINKQKRNLAKLILDMDSAKTRFQQAQKHSTGNAATTKTEAIKEEMEECESRVEQCRDMLACDMFQLIAKESDVCLNILQYCKLQRAYHESAVHTLEKLIPELEKEINSCSKKTVYGFSLEEHLRISGRKIAYPIELCVCALLEIGITEEGLFRLTGSRMKLNRMKYSIDAWCATLRTTVAYKDPHVIAGALKSYLRELPEPLFTTELHEEWLAVARLHTSSDSKMQALWQVVQKLPQTNLDNLKYLIKFFNNLSKYQDVNKMTPQNIAIVIAPSMMLMQEDVSGMNNINMNSVNLYTTIVDMLVTHADWFFPGDVDFYQTLEPLSAHSDSDDQSTTKHQQRTHVRNHSGDFIDVAADIKRSQSNSSLADDVTPAGQHANSSPKPITRRKNKSAAPPVPPPANKNKEDKPDKPPRPSVVMTTATTTTTTTLPRPKKENKSTETMTSDETGAVLMTQSLGPIGFEGILRPDNKADYVTSSIENINISYAKLKNGSGVEREKTSVSTNTDVSGPPVAAPRTTLEKDHNENINTARADINSAKKEWLLGKENEERRNENNKPSVPDRPAALKTHSFRVKTTSGNNYENVSVSSNDSSSDERLTLQKTQMYSIDKKQVSIVNYENNNDKRRRNSSGSGGGGNTSRPISLPGAEKPERPPKPEFVPTTTTASSNQSVTSSHNRTFSDGQVKNRVLINRQQDEADDDNNRVGENQQTVKHPSTSPPPVPAKPKILSVTDHHQQQQQTEDDDDDVCLGYSDL